MKVLLAGMATETINFSLIPAGKLAFENAFVSLTATSVAPNLFSAPLHAWRRLT